MHFGYFPEAQPAKLPATDRTLDVIARAVLHLFNHGPAARTRVYVLTRSRHFQGDAAFFAAFRAFVPGVLALVAEVGSAAFPRAHELVVRAVRRVF